MSQELGRVELHVPRGGQSEALPAAIGMHLGLAIVCGSAVYTGWQTEIVTYPQWGAMLLVAGALLVSVFMRRGAERATWVRLTLALAGLMVLRLGYDPQLAAIWRLGDELPRAFTDTYPSVTLIGVIIAFLSWLAYRSAGCELELGVIPLRRSAAAGAALLVGLSFVCFMMLHGPHGLPLSEALRPMLTALEAGMVVVILLGIGGGPVVRRAPHIYLALTLVAAFARNMVWPME